MQAIYSIRFQNSQNYDWMMKWSLCFAPFRRLHDFRLETKNRPMLKRLLKGVEVRFGQKISPGRLNAFWCNFAIAKVTRNPSFYHFVFCVWIKAKNITIARYFSPKCTSYYYIVFYFFSTVSSRCHFPVLCLVARERQFTLRCPRTLFSANNSNFSRVWNELETSIWQHGKLQFEIYSRTIFVVTFDAISIEWIIIGYFFSAILASLEMRRWYTIIFFSAGHSTEPEPTYNGFHVPFKQI